MAQHFMLSAQARTLSLREIYKSGEEKAYEIFKKMRWQHGEPACPRCGCIEPYEITTRRKFKCKACYHQFSVTSGTIFSSRKMDFTDLLAAICIFVNAAKGVSALQLSRDLDCQYKTAFVMAHKLREAMQGEKDMTLLEGDVEIDGAYFGGHIRPSNLVANRIDRRLAKHQTGTRRVVVAIRERKGAHCHLSLEANTRALNWRSATLIAWRSCTLTRLHIGMLCTLVGKLAASTTVKAIQ